MPSAGIAGAGLAGRLLALQLIRKGWRVTLFDRDRRTGEGSAGLAAAGMLAPYAELETAETLVFTLGMRSLELWPRWLAALDDPVFFQHGGTLLLAHHQDRPELERFVERIRIKLGAQAMMEAVADERLVQLEPELAGRFQRGVLFPGEAQLSPTDLFPALEKALLGGGVVWYERTAVEAVRPGCLLANGSQRRFDWAVDARGLGAKRDIPGLRGVRGEIVTVHAPEVKLNRLIRLMHPRYPLYIAPRPGRLFVIGATSIESEDLSPISVRSLLELLSAAYTVHRGFAEARVAKTITQLRPALPDHLPRLFYRPGLIRINGLYRHGYLQGPAVVEEAMRLLEHGPGATQYPNLVVEETHVDSETQ